MIDSIFKDFQSMYPQTKFIFLKNYSKEFSKILLVVGITDETVKKNYHEVSEKLFKIYKKLCSIELLLKKFKNNYDQRKEQILETQKKYIDMKNFYNNFITDILKSLLKNVKLFVGDKTFCDFLGKFEKIDKSLRIESFIDSMKDVENVINNESMLAIENKYEYIKKSFDDFVNDVSGEFLKKIALYIEFKASDHAFFIEYLNIVSKKCDMYLVYCIENEPKIHSVEIKKDEITNGLEINKFLHKKRTKPDSNNDWIEQ